MKTCQYLAVIALALISTAIAEEREWSRGPGEDPFVAELLYLDASTKSVVLMGEDGEELKVAYVKLADADKKFVLEYSKSLAAEAKKRKVATSVSEIFYVLTYSTSQVATSCTAIGVKSKLPGSFYILGDVRDRGGKSARELKGKLTLVKFTAIDTPVYRAESVRPAPPREVRQAREGK